MRLQRNGNAIVKKRGKKKIVTKEMLDYVQLAFEKTPQLTFK